MVRSTPLAPDLLSLRNIPNPRNAYMEVRSLHKLDLRGAMFPFALLKISQAFRNINPGDSLEILWRDPDTWKELLRVLPDSAYDLVSKKAVNLEKISEGPIYRMEIKKRVLKEGR